MKSKHLLAIVFLCINFLAVNGQSGNFDISKYKLPDIKTNTLDLNMSSNQAASGNKQKIPTNSFESLSRTSSLNGEFDAIYRNYRNTRYYQGTQEFEIESSPSFYRIRSASDTSRRSGLYQNYSFYSSNRFYNSQSTFFEIDPGISYISNIYTFRDTRYSGKGKSGSEAFKVTLPLGVGFGRLEPVQDARLAVYIIDELKTTGRLKNTPSDSVIIELAKVISKIKNKRFFDYRIRKIEEMQTVDSFLVKNNLVTENDMVYFTALRDQWDYASGPARNAGFSLSVGLDNSMALLKDRDFHMVYDFDLSQFYYDNSIVTTNTFYSGPYIKAEWSKPHNLYWQSDFTSQSSYIFQYDRDPSFKDDITKNFNTKIWFTEASYNLRFIPNSRTTYSLSANAYYRNSSGNRPEYDILNEVDGDYSLNELSTSISASVNYYFSPQLRIQAGASFSGLISRSDTKYQSVFAEYISNINNFNESCFIGFTYSFF